MTNYMRLSVRPKKFVCKRKRRLPGKGFSEPAVLPARLRGARWVSALVSSHRNPVLGRYLTLSLMRCSHALSRASEVGKARREVRRPHGQRTTSPVSHFAAANCSLLAVMTRGFRHIKRVSRPDTEITKALSRVPASDCDWLLPMNEGNLRWCSNRKGGGPPQTAPERNTNYQVCRPNTSSHRRDRCQRIVVLRRNFRRIR
jgi:hypothetical protein